CSVAISSVMACRWPPESRPTLLVMRSSRPRSSVLTSSRNSARSLAEMPVRSVRGWPRRRARARFSSMPMVAAVPIIGSWNTRPMYLARLCSGRRVMSLPSIRILPMSMGQTPATALSMVDLPAPLPPMTVTKSPSSSVRSRPLRATFWLTVPALKVLYTFLISSILVGPLCHRGFGKVFALPVRDGQEDGHHHGAERLEHVGVHLEPDDHLVDQVVDDAAHRHREHLEGEVVEHAAEQSLADDDGGQADDDGAAAHVDIGKALVLGQQRAGQRHQAVGDHQTDDLVQ